MHISQDASRVFILTAIMDKFGFFRTGAAVPDVKLADPVSNAQQIGSIARNLANQFAELIVFPELSLTGYSCADLFNQSVLLNSAEAQLKTIAEMEIGSTIVVGAPLRFRNRLFNCAVVISHGKIRGVVPKSYLPNYNEFYEKRWFASGAGLRGLLIDIAGEKVPFGTDLIFETAGVKFAVEICEDMWVPQAPGIAATLHGADVVANLSATNEIIGKHRYLVDLIKSRSATQRCGYVYASSGWGESSTDLVFSGNAIVAEDGVILREGKRFHPQSQSILADLDIEKIRNDRRRFSSYSDTGTLQEETPFRTVVCPDSQNINFNTLPRFRHIDPYPFVPSDRENLREHCEEIISIQSWGLARRLKAIGSGRMTIGISGGLDSTLALLVAVRALDMLGYSHADITAVTMPGFGTTSRTRSNAWKIMEQLGVTPLEIPIGKAVEQHFADIGHDPKVQNATYENSQARERTQILMDIANKTGGIEVGTGDLSELALGWCTYNGDQMSMYGVNASVPKTLVKYLVEWFAIEAAANGHTDTAETLRDIIDTPISPELIPPSDNGDYINQKTEDLVGPYDLHDFFLYHFIRNSFSPEKIKAMAVKAFEGKFDEPVISKWLGVFFRRFFSQQFKRSCMPDGPKVGSVCLSPRGDWRMPSDASPNIWR